MVSRLAESVPGAELAGVEKVGNTAGPRPNIVDCDQRPRGLTQDWDVAPVLLRQCLMLDDMEPCQEREARQYLTTNNYE